MIVTGASSCKSKEVGVPGTVALVPFPPPEYVRRCHVSAVLVVLTTPVCCYLPYISFKTSMLRGTCRYVLTSP
jgi:hypothetical protein